MLIPEQFVHGQACSGPRLTQEKTFVQKLPEGYGAFLGQTVARGGDDHQVVVQKRSGIHFQFFRHLSHDEQIVLAFLQALQDLFPVGDGQPGLHVGIAMHDPFDRRARLIADRVQKLVG